MRKIVMSLVAAGLLFTAAPAFAQIGVEVGPGGVGVEVGHDRDRDYRRDRLYEGRRDGDRYERRREYREGYRFERRRYRAYRSDECRTVISRRRMPDGTVVIRRSRSC